MSLKSISTLFILSVFMVACQKEIPIEVVKDIRDLQVPDHFDYSTIRDVQVSVQLLDNQGLPVKNCRINLFDGQIPRDPVPGVETGGNRLFSGLTNSNGIMEALISVPSYLEELVVSPVMPGFPSYSSVPIFNQQATITLGGPSPNTFSSEEPSRLKQTSTGSLSFLGTWNSQGVPNYLSQPGDVVSSSFLANINSSLPEYSPLTTTHPEYLEASAEGNLILVDSCDVWVTFVHEGANWKNSLGYYTYNVNNPPANAAAIANKTIIFPNFSMAGSGGGLYPGDKVYLGQFGPGTVVAWFLIANAWNSSNQTVGNGTHTLFSDPNYNPEANPALRKHQVLLYNAATNRLVIGFEDIRRDQNGDNDFNDAVFFATANPITAVETSQVRVLDIPSDTDNDGVTDSSDDFPNDPLRAFNNHFPALNQEGTLAFEDLWPSTGDYDFNDLVVGYHINQVTNALNNVVEIFSTYKVKAIGAGYHNGFGTMLGVPASAVQSISGSFVPGDIVTLSSNGTEAGQSKAVAILCEDAWDLLPYPGLGTGVNTDPLGSYVTPQTITQHIVFTNAVSQSVLGTPPYNPFIFVDGSRSREVHLPNKPPTDLADDLLFGTMNDNSQPAGNRYYMTEKNLPWAINLPVNWDHPVEKSPINQGYLKFTQWAQSGGQNEPAWYNNSSNNYRNNGQIYTHP